MACGCACVYSFCRNDVLHRIPPHSRATILTHTRARPTQTRIDGTPRALRGRRAQAAALLAAVAHEGRVLFPRPAPPTAAAGVGVGAAGGRAARFGAVLLRGRRVARALALRRPVAAVLALVHATRRRSARARRRRQPPRRPPRSSSPRAPRARRPRVEVALAASAAARQSAADARAGSNAASNAEIRLRHHGLVVQAGADAPLAVRPKKCGARRKRRRAWACAEHAASEAGGRLGLACFGAHTGRPPCRRSDRRRSCGAEASRRTRTEEAIDATRAGCVARRRRASCEERGVKSANGKR